MHPAALKALAEDEIAATRDELPDELAALAAGIPVAHHLQPPLEVLGDEFEPDILGLFVGPPHGENSGHGNDVPAQIYLFLTNLWEFAEADEAAFLDEVRITYLHELGHYFGWDEEDLSARDLD
ncbi:metallopeptidase family protein [Opitutaceae bacterium]|jgi:predicted Zn-dependent protease with MMP-like domain|nr:metallopeptidase family protein [Opitutaceae bacterium]